ncbi:zinc-binding dehydrogenase [Oxalobacteraceae bacterium OTU3CINTB1]|nr:zinc-binding dehydrogenase [Oxalobacteraceae bacterium OTU3CINTB1]
MFTTVREANFEFARSLGADVPIDYEKENYVDAVMRETNGRGVDVVLDTIGGDTLARSPTCSRNLAAWSASWTLQSRRT